MSNSSIITPRKLLCKGYAQPCHIAVVAIVTCFGSLSASDLPTENDATRVIAIFASFCDPAVDTEEAVSASSLSPVRVNRGAVEDLLQPGKRYSELSGWYFEDFGDEYVLVNSTSAVDDSMSDVYAGKWSEYTCSLFLPPDVDSTALTGELAAAIGHEPTQVRFLDAHERRTWEFIDANFSSIIDIHSAIQPGDSSFLSWTILSDTPLNESPTDETTTRAVRPTADLSADKPASSPAPSEAIPLADSMVPPKIGAVLPAAVAAHRFDCSSPFRSLELTEDGRYVFTSATGESISERYTTHGGSLVLHDAGGGIATTEVSSSGSLIHGLSFDLSNGIGEVKCRLRSHEVGDVNPRSQYQACNTGDRRSAYIQQISVEGQSRSAAYRAAGRGLSTRESGYSVYDSSTDRLAVYFPDLGHRIGVANGTCPTEGTLCDFWHPDSCVPD